MQLSPTGQLTLYGLTIRGGVSSSVLSGGGGIFNAGGVVTVLNTTFDGNSGHFSGGFNSTGGMVTILNSTFIGNYTPGCCVGGGGLYNAGALTITNSTIARNVAGQGTGGRIRSSGTTYILNSTIAENIASGLGGSEVGGVAGPVVLQNTILAHNTFIGHPGEMPSDCADATSLGHNLIGDLTGESGLGDFIDDGTPGRAHYPLLGGSQAIDAGDDAACPPVDQLGQPRVGICDIGAVEFQGQAVSLR